MAFGQKLRERLGDSFNGKQQALGLAKTYGPEIIAGLRDRQLSLGEIAAEQGTSINTVRQAFQSLIALGKLSRSEYDAYMARNNSLSQEKRADLKNRQPKEKKTRQPRQELTKSPPPPTDAFPKSRSSKEKLSMSKPENPKFSWLEANLYESRWRNKKSGLPDLDLLAVELQVSKTTLLYWKQKIDAKHRENASQ